MKQSFFQNIPEKIREEFFETIIESKNIKIEKIVSKGHCSPKNFWYDEKMNEFVLVLQGSALLQFEKNSKTIYLKKGDFLNIESHSRHRVLATDKNMETVWLAVYYQ
ncbi:MAG: cupin domain-containing protein [Desulfobacteraceae bacterium]|nr:cupin domain-containing protein [Desulfobacteraceae bacterium]MCB9494338.1 cupin domain-containing protein [Desulfobacteraceae bacterium]